jgi:hypothetical protein
MNNKSKGPTDVLKIHIFGTSTLRKHIVALDKKAVQHGMALGTAHNTAPQDAPHVAITMEYKGVPVIATKSA